MIVERPSHARGQAERGGLDSRFAFSFGPYYDPEWMGFGALRVANEIRVQPGAGFGTHRHANMEILSYVVSGALSHQDSRVGAAAPVGAGGLQWLGAGHGLEHSEANASATEPLHLLQFWIQPARLNHVPAYARREAAPDDARGRVRLASPDGADGSLAIRQDAHVDLLRLDAGTALERPLDPSRRYWLQVVKGELQAAQRPLRAGDALGLEGETGVLALRAGEGFTEALLLDLPL